MWTSCFDGHGAVYLLFESLVFNVCCRNIIQALTGISVQQDAEPKNAEDAEVNQDQ